ncbi:MAG: hypothetical protein ACOYVK_00035 [Bacillota bacterium]
MKKYVLFSMILIFISIFIPGCIQSKPLQSHEIAMINNRVITMDDLEDMLAQCQLERALFEYNRFRNNIYPKLELLHLRTDVMDEIIESLQAGEIEQAKTIILDLQVYESEQAIKDLILKEIDQYAKLIDQQSVYHAVEQLLIRQLVFQEAESRSLEPTENEVTEAYQAYLEDIFTKQDSNIFYRYYYEYLEKKEKELLKLETEDAYQAYLYDKIKYNLTLQRLKKEIGNYRFNGYIKGQLAQADIVINSQYSDYLPVN